MSSHWHMDRYVDRLNLTHRMLVLHLMVVFVSMVVFRLVLMFVDVLLVAMVQQDNRATLLTTMLNDVFAPNDDIVAFLASA